MAVTRLRPENQHRLLRRRIEQLVITFGRHICDKRRDKKNASNKKRDHRQRFHTWMHLLISPLDAA